MLDSLAFEAEANLFARPVSELGGGRVKQAFVGLKAGKRYDMFGLFGAIRPGVRSFSRSVSVYRFAQERLTGINVGRKNFFTLNLSGVVELCPASRVGVRFDVGDTITRHPIRNSLVELRPVRVPVFSEHNFQSSTALSCRF